MSKRAAASTLRTVAACGIAIAARAETLRAGAQISDCRSALVIGAERCAALGQPEASPRPADEPHPASGLEAEVDRFLAGYGKPSREVARALLDPTDDHVRAMLRSEEQRLAVAAYVGSRLTELRERRDAAQPPAAAPSALGAMVRMRALLVTPPEDADGRRATRELERVAAAFGALDARLVWVADLAPRAAAIEAAARGVTLPIRVVPPPPAGSSVPYLLLQDERYRLGRRLPAHDLTGERIRAAILGLREQGRAR